MKENGGSWSSILNITENKDPNHKALASRILEHLTTHTCKLGDLAKLRDSWALSDPDIDEPPTLDDEVEHHCDDNVFENATPALGFFPKHTMGGGFL